MTTDKKRTLRIRKYLSPIISDEGSDIKIYAAQLGNGRWTDALVSIRDCRKSIDLSFCYENDKERASRLVKLDTLIDSLTKLREWMEPKTNET